MSKDIFGYTWDEIREWQQGRPPKLKLTGTRTDPCKSCGKYYDHAKHTRCPHCDNLPPGV